MNHYLMNLMKMMKMMMMRKMEMKETEEVLVLALGWKKAKMIMGEELRITGERKWKRSWGFGIQEKVGKVL